MTWLLLLVVILQAGFHWVLNTAIVVTSKLFELRFLNLLILILIAWIFSGRGALKNLSD
ncbi:MULTISPECIES: hypothetical protein [unclassified Prochlorococcus]|uniref:hypothetical protein n=1 Tax=unclassified Prochlorococcus TaxID=2627481 RepID=UPI000533B757|nr:MULTISPECIES: hypothetical protein [unclassified Prochlorococcus]KGG16598.1 hypothetical protein EV06_0440 [Prochlorococcus sp. MIT 0602]KGG18430.1 hypothetical protein EV07_0346 [Prochlorococcus sp. MIT 0603]